MVIIFVRTTVRRCITTFSSIRFGLLTEFDIFVLNRILVKVMSSKFILLVPFICLTLFACGQKKDLSDTVEERIKQVEKNVPLGVYEIVGNPKQSIWERMKFYNVQGISIAVINDYKVEWAKGYGWADTIEQRPVTPETFFQIGSISKSLNAMGILKLAQDNKIDINADINNYLTSWKFPYDDNSKSKKITTAQLLSHSAGLTGGGSDYKKGDTLPTIYEVLDGKKPATSPAVRSQFEPGTTYQYSNGGASVAMLIATDITGKTYENYIKETVLMPLGMNNTFFTDIPPANLKAKFATGYYNDGKELEGKYSILTQQAGGAAWSTPSELCKYIIEMQLSLKGKSNKILSKETTQKMLTRQIGNVGLGVFVDSIGAEKYFSHTGGRRGFTSLYYGSFEGGKGVVVFVNSSNASAIQNEIAKSVATAYGWKDFYKPKTKSIISMSEKELDEYKGEYVFGPKVSLFIDCDSAGMYANVTGQNWYDIFPESKDKFFGQVAEVELEFVRSNHKIDKLIYKVGGKSQEFKKTIVLSDNDLSEYVGEYIFSPTFSAFVSKHGNRLQVKMPEQDPYDIFPEAKNNFFVGNAELEFVRTNNIVNKLMIKADGQVHESKKK